MTSLRVMLLLSLLTSIACAQRVEYLRGTSQVFPVKQGDTVTYPETWTGAWILSDAALLDLLEAADCEK